MSLRQMSLPLQPLSLPRQVITLQMLSVALPGHDSNAQTVALQFFDLLVVTKIDIHIH